MTAADTCRRKNEYKSRRVALKSLQYLKRRFVSYAYARIYRCRICRHWHITSGGGHYAWPLDERETA